MSDQQPTFNAYTPPAFTPPPAPPAPQPDPEPEADESADESAEAPEPNPHALGLGVTGKFPDEQDAEQ
jgi:hypothetical protein